MSDSKELDDFDEIEKSGRLNDDLNFSNIYNVKVGGFGDVEVVRTFLTSLTVEELEQDISVYETLSKDKNWPVSQIIQREVDKIRVSNISKDYVLRKERLVKYFPPIIIAILPKSDDDSISLKLEFGKDDTQTIKEYIFEKSNYRTNTKLKEYFVKAENLSLVNGFYFLQVSKVFDFNILCWDKSKYYAVVIDGQHRLESLIRSKKLDSRIKNYYQDVVFVEFSQLIKKFDEEVTPVDVVRRVFVDINTNAKRVGVVRQILMDDKDLPSLLVQSLVDSVNRDGSEKDKDRYLSSQVVDWYGESLKHNLPHITGILALQQIISDYVLDGSLSSIENLRSPSKVKKWVNTLNAYFLVDRIITRDSSEYSEVQPLSSSLHEYNRNRTLDEDIYEDLDEGEFKETTLFVYDYRTLEIAQKSFEQLYARSFVKFFNDFLPYRDAYDIITSNRGFDSNSTVYKALLSSRNKIATSEVLRQAISRLKAEMEARLNEQYFILFSVLGQKTLFNILFKRIFLAFNHSFTEEMVLKITENFIEEINELVSKPRIDNGFIFGKKESFVLNNLDGHLLDLGSIASQFWEGIIYESNRIIYNSQGIKSFSSAIEYLIALNKAVKNNTPKPKFEILFMKQRIKRIIKKTFDSIHESEIDGVVKEIVEKKEEFIVTAFESF